MKASNLRSGWYYARIMAVHDGAQSGVLHNQIFRLTGNQVQYFGTEYFDDAKKVKGEFYRLTPELIENKINKVDK